VALFETIEKLEKELTELRKIIGGVLTLIGEEVE